MLFYIYTINNNQPQAYYASFLLIFFGMLKKIQDNLLYCITL